jgi:hypothetical protein
MDPMDPLALITERHGVFLTREALALGYDERSIARAVRGRLWHRVRRGAYVPFEVWASADAEARHLIRAAAVHRSYGDRVCFSHVTAALMHGIAVWGVGLERVHVTRLDGGAGRTEPDVVHHEAQCLDEADVVRLDGRLVTAPARSALETGILGTTEASLVSLDSLLFRKLGSLPDLGNAYDVIQHWPGTQHLQMAVRMADGRAQSPGESRSRWLFFVEGIPAPELQFEVYDAHGALLGTTDFAWRRHRLLGEFDGRVKYGRLLRPGETPGDVVFAEKLREDALRRTTGFGMERLVWADLNRPRSTAERLRAKLRLAA